jgi:hypothetical protein
MLFEESENEKVLDSIDDNGGCHFRSGGFADMDGCR